MDKKNQKFQNKKKRKTKNPKKKLKKKKKKKKNSNFNNSQKLHMENFIFLTFKNKFFQSKIILF